MMTHFELSYGAFDFMVNASGDWIFLEVNPSGQWGWMVGALPRRHRSRTHWREQRPVGGVTRAERERPEVMKSGWERTASRFDGVKAEQVARRAHEYRAASAAAQHPQVIAEVRRRLAELDRRYGA